MPQSHPPEFILRFFRWFCDPELHPFIEGDLLELYHERVQALGLKRSNQRFALDVLLLFRPSIIRSFHPLETITNHNIMLHTYFKIGFRSLNKHRFFSLINITGMTIGMTCFILIALYIQYESSYDQQHEKVDRIYRVAQIQEGNDFRGSNRYAVTPLPLVPAIRETFSEVEAATALELNTALFSRGDEVFYERGLYADEHLFDVFSYPLIEGVGAKALEAPNSMLVTESFAKKYFGEESPLGQTLVMDREHPLVIKGILADIPKNQHFTFDYVTSYTKLPWYKEDIGVWNSNNYRSYVVLAEDIDYKAFEKRLDAFDTYTEAAYANFPFQPQYFLQPLSDIHLHSKINIEMSANGDMRYIYLSASIAFIILLLAAINYINLATARSAGRAKEVGMRKVLGAKRGQLVSQFIAESLLITLFSFGIAIGLAYLLLPAFNQLVDKEITLELANNHFVFGAMFSTALLLGGLSGLYPAILSSAIAPVNALKGKWLKRQKDGAFLRHALVVGQFAAAIILAIGSVVIYQQLQYIQDKKLGFNRDQIVYVNYNEVDLYKKVPAIKTELLKHPQIEQVSMSSYLPLNINSQTIVDNWEGNTTQEELWIYRNYIDYDFIDLFEMEMAEGRNFSPDHPSDSTDSYILNEAAVKALGWESGVGKKFNGRQVIGVLKDFHFQPLDLAIEPIFISFRTKNRSFYSTNIAIKGKMADTEKAIAHIEETMNTFVPQVPFDHRFLDESYQQLYKSEKQFGQVFNIFTCIALFIACMGLFGLVTHKVIQRTKEIGIRKVLGASVSNIVSLIAKDFLQLVIAATLIAIPIAWWGSNRWLQDFAYRIDVGWPTFLLIGVLAIGLAFLTVSTQALRAATANPADTLNVE